MKRIITAALLCTVLCATAFAQNESDFKTDGRGTITGYEGWDTNIVIPARIGGVAVTAIGNGAFKNGGFTGVVIPASVKSIGVEAFSGNKLTVVTLPAGVYIGEAAFSSNQLTSLTVPDGVTIGERAFRSNQLTSLTIGNGVSIRTYAFLSNQLTSLTVGNGGSFDSWAFRSHEDNIPRNLVLGEGISFQPFTFGGAYTEYMCNGRRAGTYDSTVTYTWKTEGDYQFIETRYGAVITGYTGNEGGRLQIPGQLGGVAVKGIGVSAFTSRSVSRMQLPDGLVFIGDSAFKNNSLTSVTIPNSVTYIGENAFSSNQLTSVTIPNSVTHLSGFSNNRLTSVTIPNSVTFIADMAFYENQLTSVIIPNSVTYIGGLAFYENQLTSVTIGANVNLAEGSATGLGFDEFYRNQGSRAGTYTRPDRNSYTWTRR